MPNLRSATSGFFALWIGSTSLLAGEAPIRDHFVRPIPLYFPDQAEPLPPFRPAPRVAQKLPDPQPRQTPPASPPELTAPAKPDRFSQPGFDPFDDKNFLPEPETVSADSPRASKDFTFNLPPDKDIQPLDTLPPEQSSSDSSPSGTRETIRERHANGSVKIEREMLQDADGNYVLDGAWRWFNDQGQLIADGDYERDRRQGVWRRTYKTTDAPLFKAAPYNQFQPPFHSEATFVEGVLHGPWTIYDSKQRKISEIYFEDGQRHGAATWWQASGTPVIQSTFVKGEIHGAAFVFDAAGKVVRRDQYEQGWKLERRTDKFPNGKPKEISSWLDGKYKLVTKDDWWNARIASFEVAEEPLRHGPQVTYFANGQIQRKQEFKRGKPVGDIEYWHENGQKALAGHFNDEGQPDGEWTWWHSNGLKSIAGAYVAGKPRQDWTWWNNEGKITRRGELNGELPETKIATGPQPTTLGKPRPAD